MTTTTTHHARQIRLPGQTHVAEGPADMTVMYLMHHAFRRDLDAFARASSADAATLRAMEAEHEGIDPALMACEAGFRRLAATADDDARRALAVRVAGLREALGAHLR